MSDAKATANARDLLRLARAVSIKLNTYGLIERLEATGYVPNEVRELSGATAVLDAAIEELERLGKWSPTKPNPDRLPA